MDSMQKPDFPAGIQVRAVARQFCGVDMDDVVTKPPETISETLWTCSICNGVPRKPVMLSRCTHIGCESCLLNCISHKMRFSNGIAQHPWTPCPLCRAPYTDDDLVPYEKWSLLAKSTFNAIRIKCPGTIINYELECKFVGSIAELEKHEKLVCERRWIMCPNRGCDFQNIAKEVKEHFKQCDKLMVSCSGCRLPIKWYDRESHQCVVALQNMLFGLIDWCRSSGVNLSEDFTIGNAGEAVLRSVSPQPQQDLDSSYYEVTGTSGDQEGYPEHGFVTPPAPASTPNVPRRRPEPSPATSQVPSPAHSPAPADATRIVERNLQREMRLVQQFGRAARRLADGYMSHN